MVDVCFPNTCCMTRLAPVSQEAKVLCTLLLTRLPEEEEFLSHFDAFHYQLGVVGEMSDLSPPQLFQTSVISALVYSLDFCLNIVLPAAAATAQGPVAIALRQAATALSCFS